MNEQATDFTFDSNAYWRLSTIVLGFGFMISMAAHFGGPSTANATPAQPSFHDQLVFAQFADQPLSVGGFDRVNAQPVFVILNDHGQRVGVLPMNTQPGTGHALQN